ncbi:short chain dehydrogenase/reductase [Pseudovirgaria hyperparasitica]|uniref:Short chain dehydrogenase/reductase n=1 Tax=Pseudovirgaria hyperparasitica TaxID=470096 RepID=A0A6A6VU36_9PEZI|nr:short chain dehydrogenase/reductase [Pseudovirgaria hyperparasitica]KAF2753665.1 short chain dehydrogenase/reductase [Pseudovirgaria hyperparasitica]
MAPNYDATSLFSVKGLVAVITGGGSGLGANVAHALDANGAKAVYVLGRRAEALERTAAEAKNGSIKPIVCDVTDKSQLAAAAAKVSSESGFINVLFANSGAIGPPTGDLLSRDTPPSLDEFTSRLCEVEMSDFTQTMHVNVTGTFFTALAFAKLLDAGNKAANVVMKSQIIVTSSIAAYTRVPAAGFSYSYSKVAASHMVKQLSTVLGPYKIRCNAIAPGFFPSEMTENMPWNKTGKDPRQEGNLPAKTCPLERTGTEEDIAGTAMWLMSPAGSYMNGSIQLIDGGRVGGQPATY